MLYGVVSKTPETKVLGSGTPTKSESVKLLSIVRDMDDEDLQPVAFKGANEMGSSARRLRRKIKGERTSLIFDDPPPRIEDEDEG